MQLQDVLTTVQGRRILVSDVLTHLKAKGLFRAAIYEVIERHVVDLKCLEYGIEITEQELSRRLQDLRMMQGLADPERFQHYLLRNGVSYEDWKEHARIESLKASLKDRVVTTEAIREYYEAHRERFGTVSLGRIVCHSRSDIDYCADKIAQGQDFVDVARAYSADHATKATGGYLGEVRRGLLAASVESAAFNAAENAVIGPFQENSFWTLYKVYRVAAPGLTDALSFWIKDQIFGEWLRHEVNTVPA